mgnify:CR=1 FL=1
MSPRRKQFAGIARRFPRVSGDEPGWPSFERAADVVFPA